MGPVPAGVHQTCPPAGRPADATYSRSTRPDRQARRGVSQQPASARRGQCRTHLWGDGPRVRAGLTGRGGSRRHSQGTPPEARSRSLRGSATVGRSARSDRSAWRDTVVVNGLRVRLLGTLEVEGCDSRLLARRQVRTLLKVLALARGQPVAVDRLTDRLWGDSPPPHPTNQLSVLASRLRSLPARRRDPVQPGLRSTALTSPSQPPARNASAFR
jgi:hypothetical protein